MSRLRKTAELTYEEQYHKIMDIYRKIENARKEITQLTGIDATSQNEWWYTVQTALDQLMELAAPIEKKLDNSEE